MARPIIPLRQCFLDAAVTLQCSVYAWQAFDKGAPGGIRTPGPLIRSQMLYPLSYGRTVHRVSG